MQRLTNALDRISNWMQQYRPEFVSLLQVGLKAEQIDDKLKDLPFKLDEQFYELYGWHNGSGGYGLKINQVEFFPGYLYYSLEEAIGKYKEFMEIENNVRIFYKDKKTESSKESRSFEEWSSYWFPIFHDDGQCYFAIFSENSEDKVPIGLYDPEWTEPEIIYDDLTAMILTVAECYESGAYYINEEGFLEEDELKVAQIIRKYNPGKIELR
ncbi:MAG: SMI1/KNR4 family protein [Rivularia sp. (in: cyanobacteria)]